MNQQITNQTNVQITNKMNQQITNQTNVQMIYKIEYYECLPKDKKHDNITCLRKSVTQGGGKMRKIATIFLILIAVLLVMPVHADERCDLTCMLRKSVHNRYRFAREVIELQNSKYSPSEIRAYQHLNRIDIETTRNLKDLQQILLDGYNGKLFFE